jgi:hypothetical protein
VIAAAVSVTIKEGEARERGQYSIDTPLSAFQLERYRQLGGSEYEDDTGTSLIGFYAIAVGSSKRGYTDSRIRFRGPYLERSIDGIGRRYYAVDGNGFLAFDLSSKLTFPYRLPSSDMTPNAVAIYIREHPNSWQSLSVER